MSNAFACTSANGRAVVLEELISETDRPMFFERVNSTVRYDSDEGHFFASPQCGNLTGSSEGPIFFLAAYALPIIQWNLRTEAWEEEHLPLLQGVTPVVESADPRALKDSTCVGGGGSAESWLASGDAAGRDESCATASCDFGPLLGERCS